MRANLRSEDIRVFFMDFFYEPGFSPRTQSGKGVETDGGKALLRRALLARRKALSSGRDGAERCLRMQKRLLESVFWKKSFRSWRSRLPRSSIRFRSYKEEAELEERKCRVSVNGEIRELGAYTVRKDTKKPSIIPVGKETWNQKKKIVFRLTDDLSGVKTYRGEIDGEYALFKMNNKSVITYTYDNERLKPGKHILKLYVKDACDNESIYEYTFNYSSETLTKVKKNR